MATYQILEKSGNKVTIQLTADNGYSETQSYIPPEGVTEAECLESATAHFNKEVSVKEALPSEPEVFPVVEVNI